MFDCKILKDSLAPCGKRLTTFQVTYPRFIHSEIMTHRMLSKSSASSRAIPFEKWIEVSYDDFRAVMIGQIRKYTQDPATLVRKYYKLHPKCMKYMLYTDPVMPIQWGREQKGMQSGDAIDSPTKADRVWLEARNAAIEKAEQLVELGVHKSLVNRLTEAWMWITVIISGTEWNNFWHLRCHPAAEKHFQKIAGMMREAKSLSQPQKLQAGDWHLPYIENEELEVGKETYEKYGSSEQLLKMISAGRCARVSYLNHDGVKSHQDDINLCEKLILREPGNDDPIHCYDSETDVLTSDGWKNWTKITGKESFCTLNLKTFEIDYQKSEFNTLGIPYKGDMYKIDSNNLNLFVTKNHKVLICETTTLKGREKRLEDYKLVEIWLYSKYNHAYLKGGHKEFKPKIDHYSYNTLALFGFALGDGFHIKDGNWLGFHLKKKRKIDYLHSLGFEVQTCNDDLYKLKYPFDFPLKENKVKAIPQSLLVDEDNYPIYEGLMNSDGSYHGSHITFANTSEILIDQFCQICVHLGYGFYKEKYIKNERICFRVSVIQDQIKPEVNRVAYYKAKVERVVDWEGKVYCVTVPNSTLMVRRKGIPVWSGNSAPLEHVAMALDIPANIGNFCGWKQFRKEFPNENKPG